MANTRTVVEILNLDLEKITEVRSLYPLTQSGMVLRYSRELSDYGFCTFRVSTKDPLLTEFGDILVPHSYHVRIKRGGTVVWQGAIVDNTERNKNYVEVRAAEYLFYLSKILIRRDTVRPNTYSTTDDGWKNYRTFSSGTMSSAVTTLFNNAKTDLGSAHILATATVGTIENPNYPANFTDSSSPPRTLTGAWSFNSNVTLQFDYHDALYVIKTFGIYTGADFELTNDLRFNFKKLIGQRIKGLTFKYGRIGSNIIDYNLPRYGQRMANKLYGIAADDTGKVLSLQKSDTTSINTYGLMEEAKAFADVKNKNILTSRMTEELRLIANPEESPINITLDEKAYPLGQFNLGDIVWVRIEDNVIDFQKERRIVGYTVNLHNTGRELITIQTNQVPASLLGAS